MSKFQAKLDSINYKKRFGRLIIAFVIFIIISGIGAGIKFGNRLPEIKSQIHEIEKLEDESDRKALYENQKDYYEEIEDEREIDWENIITFTKSDYIFLGIEAVAFGIFLVIYWLLVAAYAVTKANRVGLNPYLFGALTLVTNLFGIVVMWLWICIHPVCPKCGKIQLMKANNCSHCGATIYTKCTDCGERISIKEEYCHGCGKKMHS